LAPPRLDPERERWLDEIVDLKEAAKIRKVSIETLRAEIRRHALRAIRLSKRRLGMTRREAMRDSRL
jgi:hypothetical protein